MSLGNTIKFEELKGKTFSDVRVSEGKDMVIFTEVNGAVYQLYHDHDCCESVNLEDVDGNLGDLVNSPILMAEEVTNEEDKRGRSNLYESFTWTFYKLATVNGYVTMRWLGESNGYYSEGVDLHVVKTGE